MATHSSVLAWRIPGTGEPGGCRLWGRTESDTTEATAAAAACLLWRKMSVQVFCPLFDWVVFLVLNCMSCWCILEINSCCFLHCAKDFMLNYVPFVSFCFYFHYSRRWVTEDLAVIYVRECFACAFLQEFYSFWSYIQIFNPFLCMVLESFLVSFFYRWLTSYPSTTC